MTVQIVIVPQVTRMIVATPGPSGPPGPPGDGTSEIICPDDESVHRVRVRKLANGDYQLYPELIP